MYQRKIISISPNTTDIRMTPDYGQKTPTIQNAQGPARQIMSSMTQRLLSLPLNYVTFADYGSANGDNALPMWKETAAAILEQTASTLLHFRLNDLKFSNSEALERNKESLCGLGADRLSMSFQEGSYLAPVCDSASVDVGFSSFAMHWVMSPDSAFQELDLFFQQRALELKPGGELLLVNIVRHDVGESHHSQAFYDTARELWDALPASQKTEKLIYPVVFKTPDELKTSAQKARLQLVEEKHAIIECAVYQRFLKHKDADRFADEITSYVFSWGECCLRNALVGSEREKDVVIAQLRASYKDRAKQAPEAFQNRLTIHYLRLKKPETLT